MFFLEFIILVVLCIAVARLSSRVSGLEKRLREGMPPASVPVASQVHEATPAGPARAAAAETSARSSQEWKPTTGPTAADRLGAWLKEDWMLKLGAFLLLLGFAWLTTYAFMHNWIGPVGRITLGIIAGSLLLGFGWYRMHKFINQGGVFLVLGSAIVILTLFAARVVYDFFTPVSALGLMFLAAAFVALASWRYAVKSMAIISLLLAAATPLLVGFRGESDAVIFMYLFVVVLGTIWLAAVTGWRELLVVALVVTALYSVGHWIDGGSTASTLLMIAYGFAAVFFISGILSVLKSHGKEQVSDLFVAAGTGIFLLLWILTTAPEEWQSLIIAAWMVVFGAGGFAVFRVTRKPAPFLIYGGVAVAMLAAATAAELEGASLTIAYIIEAAVMPFIAYALLRDLRVTESLGFLMIAPGLLAVPSMFEREWRTSVFHEHFFVLLLMAAALAGIGLFIWKRRDESPHKLSTYPVFIVGGLIFAYVLLWLSLHAAIELHYVATMASLAIYTIIGLISYFSGKFSGHKLVQTHGGVLIGFVVGRLLLIDVWDMEIGGRIVTFFLIGALLMATAFVGRKHQAAPQP